MGLAIFTQAQQIQLIQQRLQRPKATATTTRCVALRTWRLVQRLLQQGNAHTQRHALGALCVSVTFHCTVYVLLFAQVQRSMRGVSWNNA